MERLRLRFKGELGLPALSAMRGLFSRKARKRLRINAMQGKHDDAVTAAVAHFILRVTELKASLEMHR